jgi:hypothetical protein
VNPSKTYAIVVGIEKYDIGNAWNLNGPAIDAARFVGWLRNRGVPAEQIRLFANPLEENKDAWELRSLDVSYQPATSDGIMDLLTSEFVETRGDVLFLFWGGHGVMGQGSHHLFFSNVKEKYLLTLEVEAILGLLRSTSVSNFSKQVVFIDACANHSELQQLPTPLAKVPVIYGLPRSSVSQFVLFAAGPGERARNLGTQRTGLFSSVLLEELVKSSPLDWPPDLPAVQSQVAARFVNLRSTGKASQTPISLYYRDWDGKEETQISSSQPHLRAIEQDLADALINCPTMQTESGRGNVLGELLGLGVREVKLIPRIADKRTHVEIIVSELAKTHAHLILIDQILRCEESGSQADHLRRVKLEIEQHLFEHALIVQLRELLLPLQLAQTDVLRIFRECARNLNSASSRELHNVYAHLMWLAAFPLQNRDSGFPCPALLFAERLAHLVPPLVAAKLREIVDRVAGLRGAIQDIRDYRNGVAWHCSTGPCTLVFEMKPKADGYVLGASVLDGDGLWTALPTEDHPVSEQGARQKFKDLVYEAEQWASSLIIEMVLPREMFCSPVDRWKIVLGGVEVAVGAYYPVVLRWADRLHDRRLQTRWRAKWEAAKLSRGQPLWLRSTDQFQPSQLLAMLDQAPEAGTFITFAFPPSPSAERPTDILNVALSVGTPVAVWWRECDSDPDIAKMELEALLTHNSLQELPGILRLIRNHAEQVADPRHPGCRLALMFDNHDHRPPQLAG